MNRDLFHQLAGSLRRWSARICPGGGDVEIQRLLVTYVDWLDPCARHLTEEKWYEFMWESNVGRRGGGYRRAHMGFGGQYSAEMVCNC